MRQRRLSLSTSIDRILGYAVPLTAALCLFHWLPGLEAQENRPGAGSDSPQQTQSGKSALIATGAKVERLTGGFVFLEGPAADAGGNLYFSDPMASKIFKWSLDGELSLVLDNTDKDNGLYFDADGLLISCATTLRKLVAITPDGQRTIVAGEYEGKPFNSPNDLWIDAKGGIYFTDPRYVAGLGPLEQDGEHVYYVTPDRQRVFRVIDNLVRPNGVIGSDDGRLLYVADHGGGKTYVHDIDSDGSLRNQRVFAPEGSDGLTMDERGNIYLTGSSVSIYSPSGELLEVIEMPRLSEEELPGQRRFEPPANLTFAGKDHKTLFICARTSLYSIRMAVRGHKTRFEQ